LFSKEESLVCTEEIGDDYGYALVMIHDPTEGTTNNDTTRGAAKLEQLVHSKKEKENTCMLSALPESEAPAVVSVSWLFHPGPKEPTKLKSWGHQDRDASFQERIYRWNMSSRQKATPPGEKIMCLGVRKDDFFWNFQEGEIFYYAEIFSREIISVKQGLINIY
jgi:hypothetical protein